MVLQRCYYHQLCKLPQVNFTLDRRPEHALRGQSAAILDHYCYNTENPSTRLCIVSFWLHHD